MSNEIVQGGDNTAVTVGEGQQVSMQVLQDVYNEITGKTEKLSKSFRLNHKTAFEDISQLNIKITQLYEQYNIVASNCTITLFHVDEGKEQFSSFERFKAYDGSSLSPVENIRLKYNFLIVLPKVERPQSYDIEIDIHSRAAMHQRSQLESGLPKRLILGMASQTGLVDIEYVDYTVARNFMVAIEQWFKALPQSKPIFGIKFLKSNSEHLPFLFRYISAIFVAYYFYVNYSNWLPDGADKLSMLFLAGLLCFSSIFIVAGVALKFGYIVERAIDTIQPISYLKLNRGDDNAIEKLSSANTWNFVKGIAGIVLAVGTTLLAKYIASYLGIGT